MTRFGFLALVIVVIVVFVWPGFAWQEPIWKTDFWQNTLGVDTDSNDSAPTAAKNPAFVGNQPAPNQVPPVVATSAPVIGGSSAMTTEAAKAATGVDVQRLATEPSAFVWRAVPKASTRATCPKGWNCTLHLATEKIVVVVGDGTVYDIVAGTFRNIAGYPASDAVWETPPCRLLAKEQAFGASEVPSFPVEPGNFSCGGGSVAATQVSPPVATAQNAGGNSGTVAKVTCPVFGERTMRLIEEGTACKLDWDQKKGVVTGTIPTGWTVESDKGNFSAGQTATFGSATFRKVGAQ